MWLGLGLVLAVAAGATLSSEWRSQGPAPEFALVSTGYENGTMGEPVAFRLSDYRGKTVVLDFMAVACTTCRTVTDDVLKPLAAEQPDVVILSIDTWSDPGSGNAFGGESDSDLVKLQKRTEVPWRHARDTDQVYVKYAAVSLPKLAVVDPDGQLVYVKTAAQGLDDLDEAVRAAGLGASQPIPALRVGLLGLAFIAGLACVFTPCGIGLLPAYVGLLLERGGTSSAPARVGRALAGGAQAALGIVAVYAALAALFWAFGAALRPFLPWLAPVLGLGLAVLGALALRGAGWEFLRPGAGVGGLGGRLDAKAGFTAFGAAYGLAGFACTGPLFLPILLAGFVEGAATGLAAFGLYTVAVAGVVVAIATLVAAGQQTRLGPLLAGARWMHKASAAILLFGGLFVAWYGAHAYGLV
jgi:cytochrome c-type biogenesis protein